jgi:hypothetical protein
MKDRSKSPIEAQQRAGVIEEHALSDGNEKFNPSNEFCDLKPVTATALPYFA